MGFENVVKIFVPAMPLQLIEEDETPSSALLFVLSADLCCNLAPVLSMHAEGSDKAARILF